MLKSAHQMHFQQLSQNLQKQVQILNQRILKLTSFQKLNVHCETYSQLSTKIKNLNNIYSKIQLQMKINMKNKNYNQYDLKDKLRRYQQIKDKFLSKYQAIGREIQNVKKKYLFSDKNKGNLRGSEINRRNIQMKNMTKANELVSRYHGVNDDLKQTEQITTAWIPQLNNQGLVINEMKEDAHQAEAQLSMADQMMRIIRNRNLITKLMLIVLIVFMGIADLLLLIVKI